MNTPKTDLLENFKGLQKLATSAGMSSLVSDIAHSRIPKIEEERFHLVILGEFNHGKSTFVNALLGSAILPMGITPTTAALNHIVYGDERSAKVVKRNGETHPLAVDEIETWVTVAGGKAEEIHHVEIALPSDFLKDKVTLVDTPGVNDLNEQRADITYGYVPRADAVIFLLDASQALKESEREFLSGHVLKSAGERLTFVLGKIDLLSSDEQTDVLRYVREGLADIAVDPKIFPLSAKDWLESKSQQSGMPDFLEHLQKTLKMDKSSILLRNAAKDGERCASYLQQNLAIEKEALELDEAALQTRIDKVKDQLEESKRNIDELHQRIRAEASAIKAQAKLNLTSFGRKFADVLPEQIDRVDASYIQQFLGPFIGDTFRDWAELQGATIASLCETLAEDIIKVTNENLSLAAKQLSSRVDRADTAVDIKVDSFKYDVGVYALGAVGTSMLMFVNTLAGGLLTLAAPILAIIIKSKVAGNIKEQAKEKAPAVILEATAAMGPHFEQCIDGFADRLCAFVSDAGSSLFQGISEVLEHTMGLKKKGAEPTDQAKQDVQARMDQATEIRDAFRRLGAEAI